MNAADCIRELTLPVVLISADGLICLALYNRLAAVTGRLRSFCRERFEMELRIKQMDDELLTSHSAQHFRRRLETLHGQRGSILQRAVQLRNALVALLSAMVCFLTTSLLLGVSASWAVNAAWPLGAFVLGTTAMIGGVGLAIRELVSALDPVWAETEDEVLFPQPAKLEQSMRRNRGRAPASLKS